MSNIRTFYYFSFIDVYRQFSFYRSKSEEAVPRSNGRCLVNLEVEKDQDLVMERRKIVETLPPKELAKFYIGASNRSKSLPRYSEEVKKTKQAIKESITPPEQNKNITNFEKKENIERLEEGKQINKKRFIK